MKSDLPTEEDVLAFLVLNTALGLVMIGEPASVQSLRAAIDDWQKSGEYSVALEAAAHARLYAHDRIHEAAIADSERRLDCERARDAVVRTVMVWDPNGFVAPCSVLDALASLRAAEAEVSRHGG